ncbi:MAG: hypothetical protein MPN21_13655 [Thermoanaerobaculia bacterium]|nr:hypothetical protein [Thermoanaerobaculia bacterium]
MSREGTLAVVMPLAFLALLALTCWAWGEAVLRRLRDDEPPAERWATASALGLGLLGQGIFLLGLVDRLDPWSLAGFWLAGHALAAATGCWRSASETLRPMVPFAAAAAPSIALALYPPVGFDATVYHLPYATRFLELGGLAFLPELRFPVFPQLAEMTFVPALMWAGDVGAQLCQAFSLMVGGGVVFAWGRARCSLAAGRLCAAMWFGLPVAVWIGAQAYVDVELALFVAAGAAAIDRGRPGLAGTFLGMAAATKYLGLFFFAAGALVLLLRRYEAPRLRPTSTAVRFSAAGLTVAGPWYARLVVLTGNPLFPFYPQLFGDSDWSQGHRVELAHALDGPAAVLVDLVTLPWDGVFGRARFHFEAPLSPWYLALLPLLLWVLGRRWVRRGTAPSVPVDLGIRWLVVVVAYSAFWLTTQGEIRFWLPALPLLHFSFAAALLQVADRWTGRTRRRSLAVATILLIAPGLLYGTYKLADAGNLPLNRDSRHAYLSDLVPGYEAIAHINRLDVEPGKVYGLHAERLRHYSRRPYLGDFFGPDRFAQIEPLTERPSLLYGTLNDLGVRYFILPSGHPQRHSLEGSPHFAAIFEGRHFAVLRLRR